MPRSNRTRRWFTENSEPDQDMRKGDVITFYPINNSQRISVGIIKAVNTRDENKKVIEVILDTEGYESVAYYSNKESRWKLLE